MNQKPDLSSLTAFAAIVSHASFRKAADELGMSPSTLSHMMRTLEEKLGVRLLHRTTRSVSPTEAGDALFASLQPALRDLDSALAVVEDFRQHPRGNLRINASEIAARYLLNHVVPRFLARYPDISLDLVTEGRLIDIVSEHFDAGVRLAEDVPQDMIAVPFGGNAQFVAVAAPHYLQDKTPLIVPDDLRHHQCVRFRLPSGKLYRWEFARRGQELTIAPQGPLMLDHLELMAQAAAQGLGVAYVPYAVAQPYLQRGELNLLLEEWCPEIPGMCLYYPGHRHIPAALRAFIDTLRQFK
ncbi:LysR family transcriptional regulator [Erwiniaceae bacterium BAC15a-03b]|uniref:LysR family transcriptional regulator n=1 Tax=Winslowiella arboricola TaxID=2978220 RepID=A0A9J6PWI9_9GAMM|nr:LysR family transcriptional regulator [Winslowiella arboricola]MCU5771942.1 LysR family transcriptional regulator [Winslowiella arboricola]MCU5778375.1 LysR family transcriptional regulator [Winslowiella arboricola]